MSATNALTSRFHFLSTERAFEDHEKLVEPLLAWTRDSENKLLFQERGEKYEVFKNPQVGPPTPLYPPPLFSLNASPNIHGAIGGDVRAT